MVIDTAFDDQQPSYETHHPHDFHVAPIKHQMATPTGCVLKSGDHVTAITRLRQPHKSPDASLQPHRRVSLEGMDTITNH
jgi:hypothetical protein